MSGNDQQQLVDLLKQVEPGFIPHDIFVQVMRLVTSNVVEWVPFRWAGDGTLQVLLVQRDADDEFWPNAYHLPGVVVRPGDTADGTLNTCFERIHTEIGGVHTTDPAFVFVHQRKSIRCWESVQVHYVEVQDDPVVGQFFALDDLPFDEYFPEQIETVRVAAQAFRDATGR